MDKVILTRKELYDLVWSEPTSSLFKKYNISYTGLKKVCTNMNIPLPLSGHWQKVQFGKEVTVEPLPLEYSGEQEVTFILRKEGDTSTGDMMSPISIRQKEIESDPNLSLIVPERLSSPDPLILATKNSWADKKDNDKIFSTRERLSISVSSKFRDRALRFMDTFIKLMRARGHNVIIKNGETYVVMYEEEVKIAFREKTKRVVVTKGPYNYQSSEYHDTGILALFARVSYINEYEWKDGKLPIESQLAKIVAKLEIKSKEYREMLLECWKQNDEREERERIQKEYQKRKEQELSDFKALIEEANRWRQVKMLRNYIKDIEAKALADNDTSEELKSWLDWANKKTDWYDPYVEAEDELLNEVDRETLSFME